MTSVEELFAIHTDEQAAESIAGITGVIAVFYKNLIADDIPNDLARELTLQFQQTMLNMSVADNLLDKLNE